jgi:hypothetical protein
VNVERAGLGVDGDGVEDEEEEGKEEEEWAVVDEEDSGACAWNRRVVEFLSGFKCRRGRSACPEAGRAW